MRNMKLVSNFWLKIEIELFNKAKKVTLVFTTATSTFVEFPQMEGTSPGPFTFSLAPYKDSTR